MYEYLTPHVKPGDTPPQDFDERRIPSEVFPSNRVFCVVGTNSKDYDVALGMSRRFVGPQSDGLVQINSAYVLGSSRAYIHRSHSGRYGMVNSEEGYQNLQHFLFGNIKISAILQNAIFAEEGGVFFLADVRIAIQSLPVPMHERTVTHLCPLLLSKPVRQEGEAGRWTENSQQDEGVHHIFTTYLLTSELGDASHPRQWALAISIYKQRCDDKGRLSLDGHLECIPYWSDSLIMDVAIALPEEETRGYYRVSYTWASSGVGPQYMKFFGIAGGVGAEIAFPEAVEQKFGRRPVIRLETYLEGGLESGSDPRGGGQLPGRQGEWSDLGESEIRGERPDVVADES
jgi:hypothetical protein